MNSINFTGNIVRDPELRTTRAGKHVSDLRVAVDGRRDQDTLYLTVVVWEGLAENCVRYLVKGQKVAVSGSLEANTWTNSDGRVINDVRVRGIAIDFLDRPRNNNSTSDDDAVEAADADADAEAVAAA